MIISFTFSSHIIFRSNILHTVSYTHLDVYKRQHLRLTRWSTTLPFTKLSASLANIVTLEPVSYTHLDVYKRQCFNCFTIFNSHIIFFTVNTNSYITGSIRRHIYSCLLYTSPSNSNNLTLFSKPPA